MFMEALYFLTALYISWIWVDYYRMIDIFDRERWDTMIASVLMGAASVFLLQAIQWSGFLELLFPMETGFIGVALHCLVNVAFFEEGVKTLAFLAMLWLFSSHFREPIDYLIYASLSALGFAAVENYFYISEGGPAIIGLRLVLASVGHLMFTAFMTYGLVLHRFKGKGVWTLPVFFLFAVASHGIYNLFFIYGKANGAIYAVLSIVYFMVSVSFLARMLNNSMNASPHFDPKKVVDADRVSSRLMTYFFIALGLQVLLITMEGKNPMTGFIISIGTLLTVGFPYGIIALRLGRFKLIEDRWEPLRFELPFSVQRKEVANPYVEGQGMNPYGSMKGRSRMPTNVYNSNIRWPGAMMNASIKVKGDPYNEALINRFFLEEVLLLPISKKRGIVKSKARGYLREKYYFKGDELFYLLEVGTADPEKKTRRFLIAPKKKGKVKVDGEYPIVGLHDCDIIEELDEWDTEKVHPSAAQLIEWVYLKPVEET